MISVVIPLYNKEKQIRNTFESVLNQTFQEFEIILVNDGSTDNSAQVVAEFKDPRIRIFNQSNQGVSAARNKGIREAKYDYIAFLDADDLWDTDYLQIQINTIKQFPDCAVWGSSYLIDKNNICEPAVIKKLNFSTNTGVFDNYFEVATYSHPPLWTSAIVVNKEAILSIGGFPEGIKSGEDLITWARLASKYKIAYTLSYAATFVEDASHLVANKPTRSHDDNDYIEISLLRIYHNTQTKEKKYIRKYIGHWYKMKASVYIRSKDRKQSFRHSFLSLRYNPWNIKVYLFVILAILPSNLQDKLIKAYIK